MLLANAPGKIVLPFAADGSKNTIPVPSQIPVTPGAASFTDGFPPLNATDPAAGGVGPSILDMNGVLNELSALDLWYSAGGTFPWDPTFSAAVGGYPKGALVLQASGTGFWICTLDNNASDPDLGGTGWATINFGTIVRMTSSVYASNSQTLATGNAKVLFDTVEFDSASLWNAANKRFVATVAGNYRVSGSVTLIAPGGQDLASQIWKNGTLVKQCFQAPQVSNVNLSLPYDAVVSLAIGDYIELYMNVSQSSVQAGQSGSNQAYVYGQLEYLGT